MTRVEVEDLATIVIGRNEGSRLLRCLSSVQAAGSAIVYVDSGSTDDSVANARAMGAEVVSLDMSKPFTAARARNAGLRHLMTMSPRFVQFLDGDCELHPDWLVTARSFLENRPDVVAVAGRLRERFPEASRYNRLADAEWDTPIGQARACGGIAMMRYDAVIAIGGFNPNLIAGEEPELCVRLRQEGGVIWRLDAEMALHDIAMVKFTQWWTRSRRAGHAFASGMALHGAEPERMNVSRVRRALIWGGGLPVTMILGGLALGPVVLLLGLAWPVQVLRLIRKGMSLERASFLTLAKFPEAQGILEYWTAQRMDASIRLIEYK